MAIKRARQTTDTIDEGVGVKIFVAVIDIAAAMKFAGSTLRDEGDLGAGVPAVLGLALAGQDFEFGRGVYTDRHILAAVGTRIDIANPR